MDSQTGVEGYYYYRGSDPNGTSTSFTTTSNLDTPQVSSGIYYLRVKTKDNIGNNASWTTLYVFKYDGTAPENLATCDQLAGPTESGVVQNATCDPYFTWSEGFDYHMNITCYYYYWGPDLDGISNSFTKNTFYNPPAVNTGTYYLRISTIDTVGNAAPWTTLFIFKYNETPDNSYNNSEDPPNLINNFLLFGIVGLTAFICSLLIYYAKEILRKYNLGKKKSRY